ncbi:MAG: ABC transporter ATP-binding protein [Candidatus Aminicenantes bacterium]|nr:ABC transporter ATP-binding protein [Candidatus Aminicenantes bacterium]
MEPVIELRKVSKKFILPHLREYTLKNSILNFGKSRSYEKYDALKEISFAVNRGEFIGIIGKNGSAKSLLLKIIAGIYKPTKGEVLVKEKLLAFLELGLGSSAELSGRDNIYLYGAVLGLRKSEIKRKFGEIVAFSELEKFIDQKLKNYSSGMQVRLAFAVAIQVDAPVLLIDEVLAVGDAGFQAKCAEIFKGFKEKGKTVIYVSHNLESIERWCDRTMLLHEGNLLAFGNTPEVIQEYVNRIL